MTVTEVDVRGGVRADIERAVSAVNGLLSDGTSMALNDLLDAVLQQTGLRRSVVSRAVADEVAAHRLRLGPGRAVRRNSVR